MGLEYAQVYLIQQLKTMNRLQGVDTAIVDQASSGVVDTPPVSSGNTGLLSRSFGNYVAGSAIATAGGPRPVTQEFNAFSQAISISTCKRVRGYRSLPDDQRYLKRDFEQLVK